MTNATAALVTVLALFASPAAADGKKLVVVVAKGSAVTNVSRLSLKRCFLGDSITESDVRLIPFNAAPNTSERAGFDRAVLGMTPEQAGRFWVDRKVRGQGAAPRSLTAIQIVKVVAKFPGAIGYVPADELTPDLQPVKLDGIAYGDPRYELATR